MKRGYKAGNKKPARKNGKRRGVRARELEGIIDVTRSGLGFVEDMTGTNDIEIPRDSLNTALNGDEVAVSITGYNRARHRPLGEVTRVLERAKTRFVGTIEENRGQLTFYPDDKRMYAPMLLKAGEPGMKAIVELSEWKRPDNPPLGTLIETIGKTGWHETEMRAALAERGFDYSFPAPAQKEAGFISENRGELLEQGMSQERRDMRGTPTFTIDPEDAKDFDDALSFKELPNGEAEVGIHIADVTFFVRPNSPIDVEAQKRGTSVYLVDRTVPMLPPALSEDLCSLRPNENRLAFSAIFTLDKNGIVTSRWFGRTIIRSQKRFSYEEAWEILRGETGLFTGVSEKKRLFSKELRLLNALAKKLHVRRAEAGAISFDQDEVKFVLDEKKKPVKVLRKTKTDANALIEEFMLLANREVAEFVGKHRGKGSSLFVYRIHDVPNEEKIEELAVFLRAIGYAFSAEKGKLSVRDLNRLFREIQGKPEEHLVKTATIRSMAKAVYSTRNIGHFGLAFEHYTHFTSPIRRYPDIMVHRIVASALTGKSLPQAEFQKYDELAIRSSEREVAAMEAERDSVKFKQVEYMSTKTGETFSAIVSGVTEWGIYVEEVETKAEGLVRMTSLSDDTYVLDKQNFRVVGLTTKKQYALGDKVRVTLLSADSEERTLDFTLTN